MEDHTPAERRFESLCYESDAEAHEDNPLQAAQSPVGGRLAPLLSGIHIPRAYTAYKWLFALIVGAATGAVGFSVTAAVQNLNGLRLAATFYTASRSPALAFALYALLNAALVGGASMVVLRVSPHAAGSGIPDVKAYLNGVACPGVLSAKTLAAKVVGSVLAVAGCLAVGKEGPLIHCGACIAVAFGTGGGPGWWDGAGWLRQYRNDRDRRDLVTCGAAAGVAAAFKAPVGGVLFALEEASTWWRAELTWRTFFTCAVCAATVTALARGCSERCGFYENGGLVLFEMHFRNPDFSAVAPTVALGLCGGLAGAAFTALNVRLNALRKRLVQPWSRRRVLECLAVSLLTSAVAFCLPYAHHSCVRCVQSEGCEIPGSAKVARFTRLGCPQGGDYYNDLAVLLFNPQDEAIRALYTAPEGAFSSPSLLLFAAFYFVLALVTFGIAVPSGLFIPTMLFGAACGRLYAATVLPWVGGAASELPPGLYALLGAAAFMGGVMRILVSLCVILLELTDSLGMVPLVMLAMLVAKSVGDRFNRSVYDEHVTLKGYPYLEPRPARAEKDGAASALVLGPPVTLGPTETAAALHEALRSCTHNAFPVVQPGSGALLGVVRRRALLRLLMAGGRAGESGAELGAPGARHRSLSRAEAAELGPDSVAMWAKSAVEDGREVDVAGAMQPAPYCIAADAPVRRAWRLFRDLGLQSLPVVERAERVVGVLTRTSFRDRGHMRPMSRTGSVAGLAALAEPLIDQP